MSERDDLAALTDDDNRTWVGEPPHPPDIRTWDGLAAIINEDESWSPGDATIEKMKAAGWRAPRTEGPPDA